MLTLIGNGEQGGLYGGAIDGGAEMCIDCGFSALLGESAGYFSFQAKFREDEQKGTEEKYVQYHDINKIKIIKISLQGHNTRNWTIMNLFSTS